MSRKGTTRMRKGKFEVLYGGYVIRTMYPGTARETTRTYELRVWGPETWNPTYYGDGTSIFNALKARAKSKGWKGAIEVTEVWRY